MSLVDNIAYGNRWGKGGSSPQLCKNLRVKYDTTNHQVQLQWADSKDTYVENQLVCSWLETRVVRKKGSYPVDVNDGVIVTVNKVKNAYNVTAFVDTPPTTDVEDYKYKCFPVSDTGAITNNKGNQFDHQVIYGFKITKNNSDSYGSITYTDACANFVPAYMDFANDTFNYGSWADTWLLESFQPVMLGFDGKELYNISKTDHNFKEDGVTDSKINWVNEASAPAGNAMVAIDLMYTKLWEDATYFYFQVCKTKPDDTWKAYAHTDQNGNIIPRIYLSMFSASFAIDSLARSRSFAGMSGSFNRNIQYIKDYVANNGADWMCLTISDWALLQMLSVLLVKSRDTQSKYGYGSTNHAQDSAYVTTGIKKTKGMFHGDSTAYMTTPYKGTKMFYMENLIGPQLLFLEGLLTYANSYIWYKLTPPYPTSINSAVGYTKFAEYTIAAITKDTWNLPVTEGLLAGNVLFPKGYGGTTSSWFADGSYFTSNASYNRACVGGYCGMVYNTGMFGLWMHSADADLSAFSYLTTKLSCKPTLAV